jgi:hypothetical protein
LRGSARKIRSSHRRKAREPATPRSFELAVSSDRKPFDRVEKQLRRARSNILLRGRREWQSGPGAMVAGNDSRGWGEGQSEFPTELERTMEGTGEKKMSGRGGPAARGIEGCRGCKNSRMFPGEPAAAKGSLPWSYAGVSLPSPNLKRFCLWPPRQSIDHWFNPF